MSLNKEDARRNALAYKLYAATKPANTTPPVTYTNATTKGTYPGHAMASPRADADAHFDHPSRGLTVQIERVA